MFPLASSPDQRKRAHVISFPRHEASAQPGIYDFSQTHQRTLTSLLFSWHVGHHSSLQLHSCSAACRTRLATGRPRVKMGIFFWRRCVYHASPDSTPELLGGTELSMVPANRNQMISTPRVAIKPSFFYPLLTTLPQHSFTPTPDYRLMNPSHPSRNRTFSPKT